MEAHPACVAVAGRRSLASVRGVQGRAAGDNEPVAIQNRGKTEDENERKVKQRMMTDDERWPDE